MQTLPANIVSIGKACSMTQVLPDRIRATASSIGVAAALIIDGREYYTENDIKRIAAYIDQQSHQLTTR